jgi:hypothetical protein
MVSKLLLAAQEVFVGAALTGEEETILKGLKTHYQEIREGLGTHKSPADYGAFPTDPYSHTPSFAGVQQPGMTGQVKEDILTRFRELGVSVCGGQVSFLTDLLNRDDFLTTEGLWEFYGVDGEALEIELERGSLAFSYCQVPIVYHLNEESRIQVTLSEGGQKVASGLTLDKATSTSIFDRTGEIRRVDVFVEL